MFSGGGIAETYFEKAGIEIVVANELIPRRGRFYQDMYPNSKMIVGDINDDEVKKEFMDLITDDVKFLIATPPCQGVSALGSNKHLDQMQCDPRNYLVYNVLDVIDEKDFDFVLIENVSRFLSMVFPYKGSFYSLEEILNDKYSDDYVIEVKDLNAKDYGVPQSRPRAIFKMYKKGKKWPWPKPQKEITLREAIGDLPSLESGEKSSIKHHYARKHIDTHIDWMKHTPTGCSAHDNEEHYPRKKNGEKVKGFGSTYKRMRWDTPAPAVTMRSDAISSQENVHPGRKLEDGTYSDARVLTLRELLIVSSLPEEWNIPDWVSDTFMRQIIGEAIPPMFSYNIIKGIDMND